jgi:hypothetical protein
MTGQPTPEKISKLRELLLKIAEERKALSEARSQINRHELVASCAEQRLVTAVQAVRVLLDAMDCGPDGNHGSEQRMVDLLTALTTFPAN